MFEDTVWKDFENERKSEEKRISKLKNPAERARQYAYLDKWCITERAKLELLLSNHESIAADDYEGLSYV